ncbi:MAG: hydrogenase maturation protease [Desulfuromonadaceae bacterium]|nr:hydrogenase maturation protease [Desulfuromonadaceae bacterium]MDD5105712.1 hydrogenase maturation protease [Desulfuromonadaceae bacterium]
MKASRLSETVIIGMGNRLLSDDGVGIAVACAVAECINQRVKLTVKELPSGGIRLMEAMIGFKRAVVVDAMLSGVTPGTVQRFDPKQFVTTKNTFSSHDTDFATAYDLGVMAAVPLPEQVSFWGIEAGEFDLFGERFTDEVAAALPEAVSRIVAEIMEWEEAA